MCSANAPESVLTDERLHHNVILTLYDYFDPNLESKPRGC